VQPVDPHKQEPTMSKVISASAALVVLLAAAAAQAEPRRIVVVRETLTYDTSELTTANGAKGLLNRIERTAQRICAPASHSPVDARYFKAVRACRAQAVAKGVDTLNAPLVTAAYAGRYPAVVIAAR